jgi:uncharacterized protein YecE (DUF72 family)
VYRIGTAGWPFPTRMNDRFPDAGTKLQRYATRYNAVELNSTFYRPHRPDTFRKWAGCVPGDFRFSFKLSRDVTHVKKLRAADADLIASVSLAAQLGDRLGPILVQLPPSLAFETEPCAQFIEMLGTLQQFRFVLEPRHVSWFTPDVEALLSVNRVSRVAADPPRAPGDGFPAGDPSVAYFRLHGTPRIYYSTYDDGALREWASRMVAAHAAGAEVWCIFDNTALGEAWDNAVRMQQLLVAS